MSEEVKQKRKRVLAFGVFDPLHEGHKVFFRLAKQEGDWLMIVVSRDSYIREVKKREPALREEERLREVSECREVDEAILGEEWPAEEEYNLLSKLDYDVLALGYDQSPEDKTVRKVLLANGKGGVAVVRIKPYRPDKYKSSFYLNCE